MGCQINHGIWGFSVKQENIHLDALVDESLQHCVVLGQKLNLEKFMPPAQVYLVS